MIGINRHFYFNYSKMLNDIIETIKLNILDEVKQNI